jgi:hypothetical protein
MFTYLKKLMPLGFIVLIWLIFSFPFFSQNKVPFSTTYLTNFFSPWNSYSIYQGPVKNNAMPDIVSQIIPWKHFTIDNLRSGIIPLWNPYSFSGTNHLANLRESLQ